MKTLGMFITMSFLINETGQAKDLQDLTLANDTITESIIQAGGQKKHFLPILHIARRQQILSRRRLLRLSNLHG